MIGICGKIYEGKDGKTHVCAIEFEFDHPRDPGIIEQGFRDHAGPHKGPIAGSEAEVEE